MSLESNSDCSGSDSDCDNIYPSKYYFINSAFKEVATATNIEPNVMRLDFYDPDVKLIEPTDDDEYDFETENSIPVLHSAEYFIPFVNHLKEVEPSITGITIHTNLEGSGYLIV